MNSRYLLILLFFTVIPAPAMAMAANIAIGVLAYDGKQHALNRWQPTADYLSKHIAPYHFQIIPLTHEEFEHAINKDELEFILTNPGHYVRLEVRFGATRLATFRSRYKKQILEQFSSVLFVRKDSDIDSLQDLKGRTLAAVSEYAFGGFQLVQDMLQQHDIDVLEDMQVHWLGFPHADVVSAVMDGKADAGTVRSGTLEKMAQQGDLDLSQVRILASKTTPDFPLLHSVDLYPEWPFAKLPSTNTVLAKAVAVNLMQMDPDSIAAQKSGGAGWTIPLSYTAVHDVLRRLQVEPYPPVPLSFTNFWWAYRPWIIMITVLFLFSIFTLLRLFRSNHQLQVMQQALHKHQGQLEEAVHQRTDELHQTNLALQAEITFHKQADNTLHEGCEALQDLSSIFVRDDLTRQQRLQSIVESVRHYTGAEFAVLSSIRGEQFELCCSSPGNFLLPPPLSIHLAQQAIDDKQIFIQEDSKQWCQYIACPAYSKGELHCLLEIATSQQQDAEQGDRQPRISSELSQKILALIAQWIGYEVQLHEQERETESKHQAIKQRFENITVREKEVLGLLVRGESTKSMAQTLKLSTKTIEMHRAHLLRKTNAKSSTEIVQLAVLARLFTDIQ